MKKDKLNNTHESKIITINGERIEVDVKLIPLIKELNKVGLVTISCCQGGINDGAYINIMLDNNLRMIYLDEFGNTPMIQLNWNLKQ